MRYRQCQPIVPYLAKRTNQTVENVLQELSEEAATNPERPRQLLAVRYYIRDIIRECSTKWIHEVSCITNHKTLIDQILEKETERVLIVTFNYDELLEDALYDHGFSADYLESYIDGHHRFAVYKLHGSIHWVGLIKRASQNPPKRAEIIDSAATLNLHPDQYAFRVVENTDIDIVEDFISIPAIAIPIQNKLEFECPPNHVQHLCRNLPKVTEILTIDWQGKEEHFLRLLRTNLKAVSLLTVVSRDDATSIAQRLKSELGPALLRTECQSYKHGFSNYPRRGANTNLV